MPKLLALFLLVTASLLAQSAPAADPPYDAPQARQIAQMRFGYAMFGWMPPPVGWACEWREMENFPYSGTTVYCEPEQTVLPESYVDFLEWHQRMYELYRLTRLTGFAL